MRTALCPNCQALHLPEGFMLDEGRGVVVWPGGSMRLRAKPLRVLALARLFRDFGKAVSRQALFDELYGLDPNGGPDSKVMDVWICRIRREMRDTGFPGRVVTYTARGYELVLDEPNATTRKVETVAL